MRTRGRLLAGLALLAIAGLVALGVWQLERRTWKLALIARVEARLRAAPVSAPPPPAWRGVDADDAYTRVAATGTYRPDSDTYVQAATALGGGFWVLTPLVTREGWSVLVNRGFVPPERRGHVPAPAGPVRVTGLLRTSEPAGAFLRRNAPAADRWYSRDVAAIAAERGLSRAAPYFIDADARTARWPRGGLTVVRFRNSHFVYALTWFGLAALLAFMLWRAIRSGAR